MNKLESSQFPLSSSRRPASDYLNESASGRSVITCHRDPNREQFCFLSNNFPLDYGNGESCVIQVPASEFFEEGGYMVTTAFHTEAGSDILRINGFELSGETDPDRGSMEPVIIPPGFDLNFNWTTDGSGTHSGWRACFQTLRRPLRDPIITCETEPTETGICFHSNNFPENYGDSENCVIAIPSAFMPPQGLVMETLHFNTSASDFLRINGQEFSGMSGPGIMEFAADGVVDVN